MLGFTQQLPAQIKHILAQTCYCFYEIKASGLQSMNWEMYQLHLLHYRTEEKADKKLEEMGSIYVMGASDRCGLAAVFS